MPQLWWEIVVVEIKKKPSHSLKRESYFDREHEESEILPIWNLFAIWEIFEIQICWKNGSRVVVNKFREGNNLCKNMWYVGNMILFSIPILFLR